MSAMRIPPVRVILLLGLILASPISTNAAALDLLLTQVRAAHAPALSWEHPADPFTGPSLAQLEASADYALSRLQADGFFSDIDTSSIDVWGRDVQAHAARLFTLARAFHTVGQSHHANPATLNAFLSAASALEGLLYDGMPKPGNWWNWEIGLPLEYGPALLLMQDSLDGGFLNEAISTLRYLIKDEPSPWSRTGQNLIWVSFTRLYLGLLTGDTTLLDWARDQIATTCVITTGEGIQPDFSFHQHGPSLQTGAYGAGLAQDIGVYAIYTRGTPWALSNEQVQVWLDYLTEGSRWAIFRNYYDPSTRGRGIVRADTSGHDSALRALLYGSSLESDPGLALAGSALHTLETWSKPLLPGDVALASDLIGGNAGPAGPTGVRMYPRSDYIIQRGQDWFLSVKMLSDRTLAAERYNDEGKQSRHLSSGVHWLLLEGDEWDNSGVRASLDWARPPGATTEIGLDLSRGYPNNQCYGLRSFVGGLADDGFGLAAMDWKARDDGGDSDLVAKKSWFFWPDGMVAVGSGIKGNKGWPVQTTALQWPMSAVDEPVLINGISLTLPEWEQSFSGPLWITADSVSYHIPESHEVTVDRQGQAGRFIDITREGTAVQSNDFLNIRFNHGTNPLGSAYAYAVMPRQYRTFGNPPFSILRQDEAIHAVRFDESGTRAVVFWQPGLVGPYFTTTPMMLLEQQIDGLTRRITVTDPTQESNTVELWIAGEVTLPNEYPGIESIHAASDGLPLRKLHIDVADGLPTPFELELTEAADFASIPPVLYAIQPVQDESGSSLELSFTRPVDPAFIKNPACLEISPYARIHSISISEDGRTAHLGVEGLLEGTDYRLIVHGLPAQGEPAHADWHWQRFQTGLVHATHSVETDGDTFVRDGSYADQNFGDQSILTVKNDGVGYWRDSFLKFDLTSLGEPVQSAFLFLHANSSGGLSGMQHQAFRSDGDWGEGSLTWNSAPTPGSLLASFEAPLAGEAVLVELTDAVNAAAGQRLALQIRAMQNYGPDGWLHYASRESTDVTIRPRLLLNTAQTRFGRWISALVPQSEIGELDDPDGDGLVNKLEFALGLNPARFDGSPFAWEATSSATISLFVPTGYSTEPPMTVERSHDLLEWTPLPLTTPVIRKGITVLRYEFDQPGSEFIRVRLD